MSCKDANRISPRRPAWKVRLGWMLGAAVIFTVCLAIRYTWGPVPASAQAPTDRTADASASPPSTAGPKKLQVMAVVNGQEIRRQQLASACLARYGTEVLESMVNKYLISEHCRKQNVVVTRGEVEEEIERTARKFRLDKAQWISMLEKERGINQEQYARDIIWPTLALRKLARDQLVPTPEEVSQAYESEYGEAVQARLIAVEDEQLAQRVAGHLKAQPDDFAKLARQHSVDINSASAGGLLHPIRRHMGPPQIEQVVFELAEGQLSPVLRIGEQYAIFKCEKKIAARKVAIEEVREQLADKIRDRKLRDVAGEIFQQLQQDAVVQNVLNDPELSRQLPGVAATINGRRIPIVNVAEECLARHGEEVLAGEINRLLLAQALKERNLQMTQADLDAELAHAAVLAGVVTPDGKADLKKWAQLVTEEQGVTFDIYMSGAVWPSTALKKLVQHKIDITADDMKKGFEANYGPRVKCRAIVMSNQRRAQEVWAKARANPTPEFFGRLAEQYSIEAGSRELEGRVPDIRKHSGQPLLEQKAFELEPGEISGVIQLGDKYVILRCEGYTDPIKVSMDEVKDLIYRDLVEKKIRLAMAEEFERLEANARIDNYLAGTTQAPKSKAPPATVQSNLPAARTASGKSAASPEAPVRR